MDITVGHYPACYKMFARNGPCVCNYAAAVSLSVVTDSLQLYGLQPLPAPLSMEFSRQEYWSGLPISSPGDLPNPGIEFVSLI